VCTEKKRLTRHPRFVDADFDDVGKTARAEAPAPGLSGEPMTVSYLRNKEIVSFFNASSVT
jgi:hypothetical protein